METSLDAQEIVYLMLAFLVLQLQELDLYVRQFVEMELEEDLNYVIMEIKLDV
jgi:hypothetical protein